MPSSWYPDPEQLRRYAHRGVDCAHLEAPSCGLCESHPGQAEGLTEAERIADHPDTDGDVRV